MKKILIVDDHTILRQALATVLQDSMQGGAVCCDGADSAESARRQLASSFYDLVILDIAMPVTNGIEFLPELHSLYPETPVLMLSMYPEEQFALKALKLGASGYITKQEAAEEVVAAAISIMNGERYLSSSFSSALIEQVIHDNKPFHLPHRKLSRREMEIMRLLSMGNSLKNVAEHLGLSIKTVSTYKTRMFSKMGFRNNADLVCYSLRNNLQQKPDYGM